jgi:glycosyltransferase involved in cell wall biosynthesis
LESADLIASKSEYLTARLNRLGSFAAKTITVVWGVKLSRFRRCDASDLRARLGISPGAPVILSPKILQPFYNVDRVVDAMPTVRTRFPDARLIVTEYAPDPVYKVRIAERVKALGLQEAVLFVGRVPHEQMPAYYSLADVTVAVPSSDGLPQTLLESMACEVPTVLSRLPCYEELVQDGESGLFVDASPDAVAAGINRLLGDPALRRHIADSGRRIAEEKADLDREVERVERSYRELLTRPRVRVPLPRRLRILSLVAAQALGKG